MNAKLMELREKLAAAQAEHDEAKATRSAADKRRRLAEHAIDDLTREILKIQGEELAAAQAAAAKATAQAEPAQAIDTPKKKK